MEQIDLLPDDPKPKPKRIKRDIPPPTRKLVQRKSAPPVPPAPAGPETLFLGTKHTINGQTFGPGVCQVPAHLVSTIKENEERSAKEERGLYERRAHVIAPGNRAIPVPPDFFDDPDGFMRMPTNTSVGG